MRDTYKGDSPGKKLARAWFWQCMFGLRQWCQPNVLVLPGRDGADIRAASVFGVKEHDVFGAERSPEAHAMVTAAYPSAQIHAGELAELIRLPKVTRNIDAMLLDFCSPISDGLLDLFCEAVVRCAKHKSVVGIGFMYGRESDLRDEIASDRIACTGLYQGYRGHRFNSAADARETVASGNIMAVCAHRGVGMVPVGRVRYHSRTETSRGVPMLYLVFECIRNAGRSTRQILRCVRRAEKQYDRSALYGPVTRTDYTDNDPHKLLRRTVVRVAKVKGAEDAASLFSLQRSTVSAWLAHDTRGTYSDKRTTEAA